MWGMAIPGKQKIMSQGMEVEETVKSSENISLCNAVDYSSVHAKMNAGDSND